MCLIKGQRNATLVKLQTLKGVFASIKTKNNAVVLLPKTIEVH